MQNTLGHEKKEIQGPFNYKLLEYGQERTFYLLSIVLVDEGLENAGITVLFAEDCSTVGMTGSGVGWC
jgi:hypothetical protein